MSLIKSTKLTLLVLSAFCYANVEAGLTWMEYELAGFDNSDGGLFKTNLKAKRYDKTTFGIYGTVEILTDFNNDWDADFLLFHSAKGNNQFVKLPYKVAKDDLCKMIDGIYIKCGGAKNVAETSDLPAPKENESLCESYKKGNYTIRQYLLAENVVPKFLQTGYYKAQFTAYKKGSEEITTFVVHVKLY